MSTTAGTRPQLFDIAALARRRDRAVRLGFADGADFLWRIAADRIAERLEDTARAFPEAVLVGTGAGAVAEALPVKAGSERFAQHDPSPAMAAMAEAARPGTAAALDLAAPLPFAEAGADLALSVLQMHWLDDPVGHLVQLRRALRPDGLMIACLFGGRTLAELRAALGSAEAEVTGGLTPRVAPMGEIRDLGALLQRAGFAMPVADAETVRASYESPLALMRELRAMGETNILAGRARGCLRRDLLMRAAELYAEHHAGPDGRVPATFELVFLTGWSPGPDQPTPLRPGSARTRLADALGTIEVPAGEKTPGGGS
jgi:SAM-dependent methyltransferase